MHLVEVVREGGERVLLVPANGVDSSFRDVQDLVDEVDDGTVGFQVSLHHPTVVQVQALKDHSQGSCLTSVFARESFSQS